MIYIISFCLFTIIIAIMSIRVFRGKKPITGSCGGLNSELTKKTGSCNVCGMPAEEIDAKCKINE